MSDVRPGNGGGGPPDDGGAHRGLPDLPPEWGSVVIPDDAAELDAEATEIRRELRREAWRGRLQRLGLGAGRRADASSIGVPIVIMSVAVITTLLSLFVVTWDHRRNATPAAGPDAGGEQASVALAEVTLADTTGARVRLGNLAPALLLLVGDCDCTGLIRTVALTVPPPITVVPVAPIAPCSFGTEKNVRCLADPSRVILGRYPAAKDVALTSAPPPTLGPSGSAPPTASVAVPVPMALAVPVDADGNAGDPILVRSPADLTGAVAALSAGD